MLTLNCCYRCDSNLGEILWAQSIFASPLGKWAATSALMYLLPEKWILTDSPMEITFFFLFNSLYIASYLWMLWTTWFVLVNSEWLAACWWDKEKIKFFAIARHVVGELLLTEQTSLFFLSQHEQPLKQLNLSVLLCLPPPSPSPPPQPPGLLPSPPALRASHVNSLHAHILFGAIRKREPFPACPIASCHHQLTQ